MQAAQLIKHLIATVGVLPKLATEAIKLAVDVGMPDSLAAQLRDAADSLDAQVDAALLAFLAPLHEMDPGRVEAACAKLLQHAQQPAQLHVAGPGAPLAGRAGVLLQLQQPAADLAALLQQYPSSGGAAAPGAGQGRCSPQLRLPQLR